MGTCAKGYCGEGCDTLCCPGNGDCSGNGICVNATCHCKPGFTGSGCETQLCPFHCFQNGRCVNGKCECFSGFTGESCSMKTCPGAGPDGCNGNGNCVENKECKCKVGFSGKDCSQQACKYSSINGECINGTLRCHAGYVGEACDRQLCPVYNGAACGGKGRGSCNGRCHCEYPYTGVDCSLTRIVHGVCKDDKVSIDTCSCSPGWTTGDNGQPCSATEGCQNNCNGGGTCVTGKCICFDGFEGSNCERRSCPAANCSGHGTCVQGKCNCVLGYMGDGCDVRSCAATCSHGKCEDGKCVCEDGYYGSNCDKLDGCGGCSNAGVCNVSAVDPNLFECTCIEGFEGEHCERKSCLKGKEGFSCSGHGQCAGGSCVCETGYTGLDCGTSGSEKEAFTAHVAVYCTHYCNPCFKSDDTAAYSRCQDKCKFTCNADLRTQQLLSASPCKRSADQIPACSSTSTDCYAERCPAA